MSEEFSFNASFEINSKESMELLKQLEACFNSEQYDSIQGILSGSNFNLEAEPVTEKLKRLFPEYSEYRDYFDGNLLTGLMETAQEDHPQLTVEGEEQCKLSIEGVDHTAPDFCTFFMVLLSSLDLSNLSGSAQSDYGWSAKWTDEDGELVAHFEHPEEEY